MRNRFFATVINLLVSILLFSQQGVTPDYASYIEKYKDIAVKEMRLYRIPASITLSQGILESGCGKSPLAIEANNHFGIKCHKDWVGDTFFFDDDEKQECFRKYLTAEESFRDHSLFLSTKPRYAALFSLDISDYTGWAMGLKQAGYATNPDYPNLLIRMIELNKLYKYDDTIIHLAVSENISGVGNKPTPNERMAEIGMIRSLDTELFKRSYKMPNPESYQHISTSKNGRKVYENNGIPFIFSRKGDTWYSIAQEFGIYAFQIYRENDMKETDAISVGQIIYLEPKKRKSAIKSHVFNEDDTMYSISQLYGVKLKLLYKCNQLKEGEVPEQGRILSLSKSAERTR